MAAVTAPPCLRDWIRKSSPLLAPSDEFRLVARRQLQDRQQTPYCCQRRNHGLCASILSCLRFAAARSLGLSGLVSGSAKMRSRHSISAIVCSASIPSQYPPWRSNRQTERHLHVAPARTSCTERESGFPNVLCWYRLSRRPEEGHSVRLRELTMCSISQPSSSGLPQRNRTYLPKRI